MNSNNAKEVYFNPNLKFEDLSYNIEKDNNSIVQDINIDLDGFENDLNMIGGNSNAENYNNVSFENQLKINKQFNTLNNIDLNLNKVGGSDNTHSESNIEKTTQHSLTNAEANLEESNLEGGSNLESSNLEEANLEESNLEGGSNLESSNLEEANLEADTLEEANLEEANLEEANLEADTLEEDNLEADTLEGGSNKKIEDEIDLNISSYEEIIHPLVNINSVKKIVNKWITNFNSGKYKHYKETLVSMYQKNIKKYYIKRENKKVVLYDIKNNKKIDDVNIPDIKLINDETQQLKIIIHKLKQKLIHLYLDIKINPNLKSIYENEYNSTLSKYKKKIELLTSYNIYENLMNKQINDLHNDILEENNNISFKKVFLPDLNINIFDTSNIYIENNHYNIETDIYNSIQELNKNKTDIFIKINIILNDEKHKNDDNLKQLIIEYLDTKEYKTINNKIKINKTIQNNKILYVINDII